MAETLPQPHVAGGRRRRGGRTVEAAGRGALPTGSRVRAALAYFDYSGQCIYLSVCRTRLPAYHVHFALNIYRFFHTTFGIHKVPRYYRCFVPASSILFL
jgi:hypothetical protein